MLHDLGWQSLDGHRQDQRLVLFYKIINGLASVETEDILTPADSRTRKNHSFKFKHLQANSGMRLGFGKNSGKFYVAIDSNPHKTS